MHTRRSPLLATPWTHACCLAFGLCLLLAQAACGPSDPDDGSQLPATVSKDEARELSSKQDNGVDHCTPNGWYGDGVCDDFCAEPDPDCVQRGVWVWDDQVVLDPAQRSAFLEFAGQHRVHAAYVHAEQLVSAHPQALAEFIDNAAARNIETELLFGAATWARTAEHQTALNLTAAAIQFSEGLTGARPTALQFDIEPYLLPEWNGETSRLANEYLDLVQQIDALTSASSLRLNLCVPFWFDTIMVPRGGVDRPLSELLADRSQRLVIMDYRDDARQLVELASAEVAYAAQIDGEVVLGVETQCDLEPAYVTFCEEGRQAMEAALGELEATYADQRGFAGVAVHHYGSYVTLKP